MVNGKTGSRRVRIIASVPALATWQNNHLLRDNPNSAPWISQGTRDRNLPLKYRTAAWIIKRVAREAGIKKRVYPHLFRHSRATELAKHLTEVQMKQMFGWVQGSDDENSCEVLSHMKILHAQRKTGKCGMSP